MVVAKELGNERLGMSECIRDWIFKMTISGGVLFS
ncbi:MAG: hypothetical protein ACJAU6_004031 [Alphaproteobacteria bacterium]|jgi:hypothetical protein